MRVADLTVTIDSATSASRRSRPTAAAAAMRHPSSSAWPRSSEIANDALPVLDRVVVVFGLELCIDPQYSQPHTADAAQHRSVGRVIDGDGGAPRPRVACPSVER